MQPDDPYILQQMALATYKFGKPDTKASLVKAKNILNALAPQTSSDAKRWEYGALFTNDYGMKRKIARTWINR